MFSHVKALLNSTARGRLNATHAGVLREATNDREKRISYSLEVPSMMIGHSNPHLPNPIDISYWRAIKAGYIRNALYNLYGERGGEDIMANLQKLKHAYPILDLPQHVHAKFFCGITLHEVLKLALEHPADLMSYVLNGVPNVNRT